MWTRQFKRTGESVDMVSKGGLDPSVLEGSWGLREEGWGRDSWV